METASTEVTSIWRRNDVEKSTWRTHQYFVDFEGRIHVEISTSNRCPRGFAFQNRCNFHELSTWNFDVESMANRRRCAHWVYLLIVLTVIVSFDFLIQLFFSSIIIHHLLFHFLWVYWGRIQDTEFKRHGQALPVCCAGKPFKVSTNSFALFFL